MLSVVVAIQFTILFVSIGLWSFFLRGSFGRSSGESSSGSQSLWPARGQGIGPHGLLDLIGIVFVWLCFQTLVAVIGLPLMGVSLGDAGDLAGMDAEKVLEFGAFSMAAQLLTMFGAIGWLLFRYTKVGWLGDGFFWSSDVKVGLVAAAMIIPVTFLVQLIAIQLIPYEHPTLDSLKEVSSMRAIVCAWFAAVVGAPLTEEFFFRGLVQGFMQRLVDVRESFDKTLVGGPAESEPAEPVDAALVDVKATSGDTENPWESVAAKDEQLPNLQNEMEPWRFWLPIVGTSVLFAGAHMGQGPAPIPLFVLSLGLGYVFRKTGSVIPCIIIHLLLNAISMGMLMLQIMYPDSFPA